MERHGERSNELKVFQQIVYSQLQWQAMKRAAAESGWEKGLGVGSMKDHEANRSIRQRDQQLRRRYRKLAKFPFPLLSTASLRVIG